jgi:hypothetical protein
LALRLPLLQGRRSLRKCLQFVQRLYLVAVVAGLLCLLAVAL